VGYTTSSLHNGHRVHSFFRGMWHSMQAAIFEALSRGAENMMVRDQVPKKIVVTGFSTGGGVST
jgi:dienelactone hydrolase